MAPRPQVIDISLPVAAVSQAASGPPFIGTRTVIYPQDGMAFPQVEPEPFMMKWLQDYRALKSALFAPYLGMALVLDLTAHPGGEVTAAEIIAALEPLLSEIRRQPGWVAIPARILIKTGQRAERNYCHLTIDAIEFLFAEGGVLIGIDAATINAPGSTLNEELMESNKIVWLVNLDLSKCTGLEAYLLNALPLIDVPAGVVPTRAFLMPAPKG